MGRRSKVDLQGLHERLNEYHNVQKKSYKEIAVIFQSEGISISYESLRIADRNARQAANEYKKVYEESKAIVDAVKDNPGTDTIEAITALLASKMLSYVKNIENLDFNDPEQIGKLLKNLSGAQVPIARLKMAHKKGYDTAKRDFLNQLNDELKEHPQLLKQLIKVIEDMSLRDENL